MKIEGTGIITASGRGLAAQSSSPTTESPGIYLVDAATLKDKATLKNMRRADRFSKMGVIAAHDALKSSGIEIEPGADSIGIITTTAFGPHGTTFKFLDDILEYGDKEVSPTKFSHSVHNAAASYIASSIGSRGPTSTVTKFKTAFSDGLKLASAWLSEERCQYVLLGYIEELSPAMEHINNEIASRGERLQTFNFSNDPNASFTEGAVFVLLSNAEGEIPQDISDAKSIINAAGK